LFIQQFLGNAKIPKAKNIGLTLEHPIPGGRIDIFLDFNESFGIAIENKPFAVDQQTQIKRYSEYMSGRRGTKNYLVLYFSPDGSLPSEDSLPKQYREQLGEQFISISYKKIADWCNKCAAEAKKYNAERLSTLIEEFAEYINRRFVGVNTLKNKMMGEALEENILEAFEMNLLWQKNHEAYEAKWRGKINNLFNEKLPELVFESLKRDATIDNNWELIKGKFDINKEHLEGFKLKKINWKHFEIGLISDRIKREKGKRSFFLGILSEEKIQRENYAQTYYRETGCETFENPTLKQPPTIWYAVFPDDEYKIWGYEQWAGIKPGGKTVSQVVDLFSRVIKACVMDIDKEEKRLQSLQ
jgi:hypothetical protein